MSEIKESALELIGRTPILRLNRYSKKAGFVPEVLNTKFTTR